MYNTYFKFRAWDKTTKTMIYDAELTYDCCCRTHAKGCLEDSFGDVLESDNYEVMQCTGLEDIHGKLIYEEDIVRVNNKNIYGTCIIARHKGILGAFILKTGSEDGYYLLDKYYELEVVGNTYESFGSSSKGMI